MRDVEAEVDAPNEAVQAELIGGGLIGVSRAAPTSWPFIESLHELIFSEDEGGGGEGDVRGVSSSI